VQKSEIAPGLRIFGKERNLLTECFLGLGVFAKPRENVAAQPVGERQRRNVLLPGQPLDLVEVSKSAWKIASFSCDARQDQKRDSACGTFAQRETRLGLGGLEVVLRDGDLRECLVHVRRSGGLGEQRVALRVLETARFEQKGRGVEKERPVAGSQAVGGA